MSSKYDKTISMSREEEGTYHRREIEHLPANNKHNYSTKNYTTHQVVPIKPTTTSGSGANRLSKYHNNDSSGDEDNFEEWTTSKRKINHKTRQVETRVSRQLLVEDGKVIADSGPQVTTRIKEDNKVEECEKEKAPKNKNKFDAISNAPECDSASGRVLGEKKEIQRVSREVREENMQYHDERFKELTGQDVHRRAIKAPHELITITDKEQQHSAPPRGKMVHYSNKGKLYQDTDEILEVAKLAIDGSITKEVKHTHHHEEQSEDELPDEKGEAEKLRRKPVELKSNRRRVDYVNDFDNTATPPESSGDEIEGDFDAIRRHNSSRSRARDNSNYQHNKHNTHDEAFPRYKIDPLLNSLNDDDYKPSGGHRSTSSHAGRQLPLHKKDRSDSASSLDGDAEAIKRYHQRQRSQSPRSNTAVEIPEEYRINKQRLIKTKSPSSSLMGGRNKQQQQQQQARERSFSPTNKSHLSHRSLKSNRSHRGEDASVQAHLTDEEIEKRSMKSSASSSINSHQKQTKHLQRQSTANSSRNYYFGESRHRHRASSIHSSSSATSSLSDPKEQMRKNGARSKDSGFKSPTTNQRNQQQIYSISSKQKNKNRDLEDGGGGFRGAGAISPTGSLGQRSVKKTTTTLSAGLADRPDSRNTTRSDTRLIERHGRRQNKISGSREKHSNSNLNGIDLIKVNNKSVYTSTEPDVDNVQYYDDESNYYKQENSMSSRKRGHRERVQNIVRDESFVVDNNHQSLDDSISICSLGPNATTIKVPYKKPTRNDSLKHEIILPEEHSPIVTENISNNNNNQKRQSRRKEANETATTMVGNDDDLRDKINNRVNNIKKIPIEIDSIEKTRRINDYIENDSIKTNEHVEREPEHFDYKTVVATVYNNNNDNFIGKSKQNQNIVDAYNVRVIQYNSPFLNNKQQPIETISDLSSSIARLEQLSSELGSKKSFTKLKQNDIITTNVNNSNLENNNETTTFDLNDYYVKHKALPAIANDDSGGANSSSYFEDDRVSLVSSCSLRSSRTYHISGPGEEFRFEQAGGKGNEIVVNERLDSDRIHYHSIGDLNNHDDHRENNLLDPLDLDNDEKKPAAWIFDPRDGSSTAIVAPARPKKPDSPKIDAKTEELAQSKGGRSYYLELVEKEPKKEMNKARQRPSSIDSLYSRWNSHNTLSSNNNNPKSNHNQQSIEFERIRNKTPTNTRGNDPSRKSRQIVPASIIDSSKTNNKPIYSSSITVNNNNNNKNTNKINIKSSSNTNTNSINNNLQQRRRQLPFSGVPLTNRSKSSSCLLSSTKPSKYSLYGGLRRPNAENKPVPRLSYSRAIGPKSQRQIDAQPKTPSRYLKMK